MEPYLRYLPMALVVAIVFERMRELRTNRHTVPGERKETFSLKLFVLCGALVTLGCLLEYVWRGMHPNWTLILSGLAVVIASFAIRRSAIAALGEFWSMHVEVRERHQFVQNGPFRWMRHPVYLSLILELLSLVLICGAFYTLILIPLLFVPVLILRIRMEEVALVEKFGDAYRAYQRTKPALFPWKW
jgi:isoprenylcysteine carboxyl methyltransferase (ICMT) family protein YpbQ